MIKKFVKDLLNFSLQSPARITINSGRKSLFDEIASLKNSQGYFAILDQLPNPDPVLRKQGKNINVYRELFSDPHVGACVDSRKSGILSLE